MRVWMKAAPIAVMIALATAGCGSSGEVDDLKAQVAEVTAERDALQQQVDTAAARHDKSAEVKAAVEALLAEPGSSIPPAELAAELASYATADAQMVDDVFGGVGMEQAWYNTLSGDLDATIDTIHQWISDDGTQSGSLWIWRGSNMQGNPFELIGVNIDSHNEEGLITEEWVGYPYPDAYVNGAIVGDGTPTTITGEPWEGAAAE
ncbi:hypothetical protein [Demequina sp.]|uniref:hypothetical protein n=1 Tax=Demequina sp. TaxID=2050685 RepID=UPI0025D3AF32|nr:hypothetical protein [Demequina sp.]